MSVFDFLRKSPKEMAIKDLCEALDSDRYPQQVLRLRQRLHNKDLALQEYKLKEQQDIEMRNKYPAVMNAWEKYQTILQLTKENK